MKIVVVWYDENGVIIAKKQFNNSSLPKMKELFLMEPNATRVVVK